MSLAGKGRVEKRLKVAQEGQTVDGRLLTAKEIQEMASTYKPELYAGRVNIEHIIGYSPTPPFNAYGDVLSVEAEQIDGVWCLFNTISALPNLIELNKDGQKLYPSIEFYRDFAGTGKAYQVGLAFTDTPASLGTEPLKFSHQRPQTVFTQPQKDIFMSNKSPSILEAFAKMFSQKNENPQPAQPVTLTTPAPQQAEQPAEPSENEQIAMALIVFSEVVQSLTAKVEALEKMMAQPAESAPTAVANTQPAQTVTTPTPAPQADVFAQLTSEIQKMSQQITALSQTSANPAPVATGAVVDSAPY